MDVTERDVLAARRDVLIDVGDDVHLILIEASTRTDLAMRIHDYIADQTVIAMNAVIDYDKAKKGEP